MVVSVLKNLVGRDLLVVGIEIAVVALSRRHAVDELVDKRLVVLLRLAVVLDKVRYALNPLRRVRIVKIMQLSAVFQVVESQCVKARALLEFVSDSRYRHVFVQLVALLPKSVRKRYVAKRYDFIVFHIFRSFSVDFMLKVYYNILELAMRKSRIR